MTEYSINLSEIKLALKRKDLASKQYRLQNSNSDDVPQEYLTFFDIVNGTKVSGKIVRSSNEKDHWPVLNHENVAPLFDVLNIRSDLKIYITIDMQVKLKDIIHKEDFVYNSRCFDRKKAYAKGIFSGLSYIHGKSLCLMNLSDDNIYVCNTHDKAVIANFSFISCSKKTTRDKLKVPEHYKAPETENHKFNAIAAEMWASGTLMLDLFLAHMVPWTIIDYKPRRVVEMVNNLSLDLLQAANAGSEVSVTDLVQFKVFLKCFFKGSLSRITARSASIASFLSVKFQKNISEKMFNPTCDFSQQTENKYSIPDKNPPVSVIPETDTKLSNFLKNNSINDSRSQECFDYNESSSEIYLDSKYPHLLKSNLSGSSGSNSTEIYESFSTGGASSNVSLQENKKTKSEINVKKNSTEITCDKQIGSDAKPYYGSEDKDSFSTSKIFLNKTSKSYQMIKEETKEFNLKNHQSKSLSLTYHDGISCETPSVRALPLRKWNESDLKMSDFYLNRLFENGEWLVESMTEKKAPPKVPNTVNTRSLRNSFEDFITYEPKNEKISRRKVVKVPEIKLQSSDTSPNSNHKMSIQRIKERFAALRKAEISLQDQKSLFISKELAEKQQHLINDYRDILRQEKIRLCEILSNEYKLSLSEVKILSKSFGSKSRCIKKYNRRSISNELQFSSSEFSDCKFADMRESGEIVHRTINHGKHKLKDSEDGLHALQSAKLTPRKRLSYCKAIESSANQVRKNRDYRLKEKMRKDPEIKNKSILTDTEAKLLEAKNEQITSNRKGTSNQTCARESRVTKNRNCHQLNPSLEDTVPRVKLKDSKKLLSTTRKEEKKSKVDKMVIFGKTQTIRKPFCFNLCLGRKMDVSRPYDRCKECKFYIISMATCMTTCEECKLNPRLEDTILRVELKDRKQILTTKKEENKSKKDMKITLETIQVRKPFCFNLCPGGKVKKSKPFDLCETCKLCVNNIAICGETCGVCKDVVLNYVNMWL